MQTRRDFLKTGLIGAGGLVLGGLSIDSALYAKAKDNPSDKIKVGIVGFSDRCRASLIPSFMAHADELGFELVAVSDIWNKRREEAVEYFQKNYNMPIKTFRNNEELYESGICDAVIISTADFQHATHLMEAVKAGCDAYCEKPLAETMADARAVLKVAENSGRVIQIGSQRRSAPNYQSAYEYIRSGKFGPIRMVEMSWNVNQPQRWRRPELVAILREEDTDWKRFLCNRPYEPWDPRKYLEYRLFWPYSSGIPGQWMSHQIDTVHWFTGLSHPRSVSALGGIYQWKDGRRNFDTFTAVMDYGPEDGSDGFQVLYTSRFTNSAGGVKEVYFSNGGMLNLDTNEVTSTGGLKAKDAAKMGMEPNLLETFKLPDVKVATSANTGGDRMTNFHMRNWMECVRARKIETNAPVRAGYNHSIATMMANAASRTGKNVTFDEKRQEILAGGKVFKPFNYI